MTALLLAAFGAHALVHLLVALLIVAIVAGIVYYILAALPPLARFAPAVAAVVFLFGLLLILADYA